MPPIDLNKTLIIHTIIDENQNTKKWEKMFEINKKILNHFGYKNIYLLRGEPSLIQTNKFHPLQRSELFFHQDMEILKDYDYVIYTELDAFFIKPIEEFQKLCDGVEEEAIMFRNYEESMRIHFAQFMFSLWSVDFYKNFISYVKKEFEILLNMGYSEYMTFCRDIFYKSKKYGCKDDEIFLSYIVKKYKLKNIVNLDCISPNRKDHLKYFINCYFSKNKLHRAWMKEDGDEEKNPKNVDIEPAFFLHVIDSEIQMKSFLKYLSKQLDVQFT